MLNEDPYTPPFRTRFGVPVAVDGQNEMGAADSIAWAVYRKALETNYRLENWSKEELEAYCGIYENKKEDK